MMNDVFEEIMARLTLKAPSIRYINWNIGQMDGYYLKPSVTFPCVLISFDNVGYEDLGNLTQIATVNMQLKIVANSLSNTSNLTPEAVRLKGNEIWEIENEVFRALQGFSGLSFNTMTRKSARKEPHEEGYQIINSMYAFAKQDSTKAPVTTKKALIAEVLSELDIPPVIINYADFTALNSDAFLTAFCRQGNQYGYEWIEINYNGQNIDLPDPMVFADTTIDKIPIQEAPYITIPGHDENNEITFLSYDVNWLTFLIFSPITEFLNVSISPFGFGSHGVDPGYPFSTLVNKLDPFLNEVVYGESFQMQWKKGDTFSFKINFLYFEGVSGDKVVGHEMIFTEKGYYIDGAFIPITIHEHAL